MCCGMVSVGRRWPAVRVTECLRTTRIMMKTVDTTSTRVWSSQPRQSRCTNRCPGRGTRPCSRITVTHKHGRAHRPDSHSRAPAEIDAQTDGHKHRLAVAFTGSCSQCSGTTIIRKHNSSVAACAAVRLCRDCLNNIVVIVFQLCLCVLVSFKFFFVRAGVHAFVQFVCVYFIVLAFLRPSMLQSRQQPAAVSAVFSSAQA